jgi:hypothetical protein
MPPLLSVEFMNTTSASCWIYEYHLCFQLNLWISPLTSVEFMNITSSFCWIYEYHLCFLLNLWIPPLLSVEFMNTTSAFCWMYEYHFCFLLNGSQDFTVSIIPLLSVYVCNNLRVLVTFIFFYEYRLCIPLNFWIPPLLSVEYEYPTLLSVDFMNTTPFFCWIYEYHLSFLLNLWIPPLLSVERLPRLYRFHNATVVSLCM